MSLESGKTLGGVGAILIAVGSFVPLLSLVGIILVLVALNRLSDHYNRRGMFENALYGFVFGVAGTFAAIVVVVGTLFSAIFLSMPPFSPSDVLAWQETWLTYVIIAMAIMSIFQFLQALFYRRSLTILSRKSGKKTFDTAGLLLLLGAAVAIIMIGPVFFLVVSQDFGALLTFFPISLVGGVFQLVAWILAAVGFFSIETPSAQLPAAAPSAGPPVSLEKRFCRYCGAETKSHAVFCEKCGKKINRRGQPSPARSNLIPKGVFCSQCGKLVSVKAKFCPECGTNLKLKKTK